MTLTRTDQRRVDKPLRAAHLDPLGRAVSNDAGPVIPYSDQRAAIVRPELLSTAPCWWLWQGRSQTAGDRADLMLGLERFGAERVGAVGPRSGQ